MIAERLKRTCDEMRRRGVDCLVLTSTSDLQYLISYRGMPMERPTIFLLTQMNAFMVLPAFEMENVGPETKQHVRCVPWEETENVYAVAAGLVGTKGFKAAISDQTPSFVFYNLMDAFPTWSWEIASPIMYPLRSCKDPAEIETLKVANHLAGKAFLRLLEQGLCGRSWRSARCYVNIARMRGC